MKGIHTNYRFRHYGANPDPERSEDVLLWASDGKSSILARTNELIERGSALEHEVMQSQLWTPNTVADEGEKDFLDVYFKATAVRTSLYFRLYADSGIVEADTLATITGEESGSGYGAITVTRGTDWGTASAATGITTVTKQFAATGSWSGLNSLVLATVGTGTSGLHIAWAPLSTTRTLVNLDTMDVDMNVTAEGV